MKIGLLSDAHGNVEAFAQAVGLLRREGAEQLYFLGDAVGYLPGHAVVEAIVGSDIAAQKGNHDAMLLEDGNGEREAVYRHHETRAAMSPSLLEALAGWPDDRRLTLDGRSLHMVHGSLDSPLYGYVYPDTDLAQFSAPGGEVVFMANTHRPFIRRSADALFVNIGSCGLPRDVGGLGSACLYDTAAGEAEIVRFDIRDATHRALARCGPVHPSVAAVIVRRAEHEPFGRLIDG
jgi:predicted phosphodiesterase